MALCIPLIKASESTIAKKVLIVGFGLYQFDELK